MYQRITGEDPTTTPMMIYPAVHYTMGGLWVDYNLMSNLPGLFVIGEANFSDHGANRLGASALMQGLADGYFILPYTIGDYLARMKKDLVDIAGHEAFKQGVDEARQRTRKFLSIKGKQTVNDFHRRLGTLLWEKCGMARNKKGLEEALVQIPLIRAEFWKDLCITGTDEDLNQALERAGRVADFLEFGELLVRDALAREESCGGHFREEYQTEGGEALRRDDLFSYVAAWEFKGAGSEPVMHKEPLTFEEVPFAQRSYK
jgi:succinate dehydrogenase / fumarate reductase flavoprotein subunit